MKGRLTHVLAGLTIGLVLYAGYLYGLVRLWRYPLQTHHYWMLPFPNFPSSPLALAWTMYPQESLAVLAGLLMPLLCGLLALLVAARKPFPVLSRWYVQMALVTLCAGAVWTSIELVPVLLPILRL